MTLLHLICILMIMFAPNYYKQLVVNTKTSAHTLIAVVHLTINISSPITLFTLFLSLIYLLFSLQYYLLLFHPLTTTDALHK